MSLLSLLLPLILLGSAEAAPPAPSTVENLEFFEKQVRPLLSANCFSCHSSTGKSAQGGLRLDSRAGLLTGGARGPALVPGQPDKSLLLSAVRYQDPGLQMPPRGRLSDEKIAILTEWVKRGAPWPESGKGAGGGAKAAVFNLKERAAKHWAWQPVKLSPVPAVRNRNWPRSPIDSFVLARLEAGGLTPAAPADRRTLLRRVTYDLIGLPPTPAEIAAFLADRSPDAYRKVVDRLLASPHYGERWGRHWLDLVRYAETDGHEFDADKPDAWRYRDYVIRALNADVPYNQFVKEQIAGDLLPHPRLHPTERFNESVIGTGFWWFGERVHSPVDIGLDQADRIDNQIDVMSKALLGLSLGCARCHDHKFDALSTRDYYALSGYLKSSRYQLAPIDPPERFAPIVKELDRIALRRDALLEANALPVPPPVSRGDGNTVLFEDFSKPTWDGWKTTGEAFGSGPRRFSYTVSLTAKGLEANRVAGPGVADSGGLSNRLQGTLRSRTFTIEKSKILYHLGGKDVSVRLIIDGFQRIQDPIYGGLEIRPNDESRLTWVVQDVSKWVGHRAYIELLDQGTGRLLLDRVLFSDTGAPGEAGADAAASMPLKVTPEVRTALTSLLAERLAVEATIPEPRRALALADGTGENDRVHLRGSHKNLGAEVPRRFLEACAGSTPPPAVEGSGRLELAEHMVGPSDPLLARVIVNRLWQHHFGEGIVRSPDDFGVMGQRPTHPELLDWLAARFIETPGRSRDVGASFACGWSLKKLHRLMLLSSTYQMSSAVGDARAEQKDPQNRLLHRMPIRRLEAEAIHDALLAVSGRLDPTLYGPSVPPYLTALMEGRGKPTSSGPLDGAGRRGIYLFVRRNFLNPMFLAFDYPVPATCMGRRSVSNVPAQALALMNNPFVVQQAEVWAQRMLGEAGRTPEQRVREMYETAFARLPDPVELRTALAFLQEQDRRYGSPNDLRSWRDLCHVLINVKEFIFVG